MINRTKQPASKQLSLRILPVKYDRLKIAADLKGISVSDETKERLDSAEDLLNTKEMLRMTEVRLKRIIFNITCAVAGLSDSEIIDAEKRFIEITKNGVKREK